MKESENLNTVFNHVVRIFAHTSSWSISHILVWGFGQLILLQINTFLIPKEKKNPRNLNNKVQGFIPDSGCFFKKILCMSYAR